MEGAPDAASGGPANPLAAPSSGLRSARVKPVAMPKPVARPARPAAPAPKVKAEDAAPPTVQRFRLAAGDAPLSVMRFPGAAPAAADLARWAPPLKMHRFEPEGFTADPDEPLAPRKWGRRDEDEDPELAPPPPSGPKEEIDLTKVDRKTARKKQKAINRKLRTFRSQGLYGDGDEAKKERAIAQLPFTLADSSGGDNEFEGRLEEGLAGDQYMLLAFSADGFTVHPVQHFYNFTAKPNVVPLTLEEAEERMKRRRRAEAAREAAFLKHSQDLRDEPSAYRAIQDLLGAAGVKIKSEAEFEAQAKRLASRPPPRPVRKTGRDDDGDEDWDFEMRVSDDEGSDNGGAAWDDEGTKNMAKERAEQEERRYRATKVLAETEGKDVEGALEEAYGDADGVPPPGKRGKEKLSKAHRRMKKALEGKRRKKEEGGEDAEDGDDADGDDEKDPYLDSDDQAGSSSDDEDEDEAMILSREEEQRMRQRELQRKKARESGRTSEGEDGDPAAGKKGAAASPEVRAPIKLRIPVRSQARPAGSDSELSDVGSASGRKRKRVEALSPVAGEPAPVQVKAEAPPAVPTPPPAVPTPPPAVPSSPVGQAGAPQQPVLKIRLFSAPATASPPPPAGGNKTGDRQMSDGEMSDGGGPRKKIKREPEETDPTLITKQEVVDVLLPTSRLGQRVPAKSVIAALKDKIRRNMDVNMGRLKEFLRQVGDLKPESGGVILKQQYM
ncbi:hypothetical protein DFJ74DRAFT_706876 [Hyaloraphidium curvatum]|nr:hypothetical protein DFJ74DRAFT_706876 [Hyaloraphidium curvatum]